MRRKKRPEEPSKARAVAPKYEGHRPFAALKELKSRIQKEEEVRQKPAPPPKPAPSRSDAFPEDEALNLHRMMSGVTPLASKAQRIPRSQQTVPSSQMAERHTRAADTAEREAEAVHAQLRALVEGGRFEVEDDGRRVEGRRDGLPHEVLRKLRRGLFPIDARIDLHGLRAEEARDTLERFLGEKRARGERCVIVVHGKGEHSPGRHGVLRGEMAAWLSQGHASVHVAAFATSEPQDGGEGATYVLLVR